jgi:hypothetical protein
VTQQEFNMQAGRLIETYGEKAYPNERLKIIFDSVQDMPGAWLAQTVTEFIGNLRVPPLQKEFVEKRTARIEADKFDQSTRSGLSAASPLTALESAARRSGPAEKEYVQFCLTVLEKKISGKMDNVKFLEACRYLDDWAKANNQNAGRRTCPECGNSGQAIVEQNGARYFYRCYCAAGDAQPQKLLGPSDRNGNRLEVYIPRYRKAVYGGGHNES